MAKGVNIKALLDSLGLGSINNMVIPLIGALCVSVVLLVLNIGISNEGFAVDSSAAISPYDNTKTYSVGAVVAFNGSLYEMVQGAGAPGYAPLRPGDQLWQAIYDNNAVYSVGQVVRFQGNSYVMVEGAGAPGYAPLRPGDRLWKKMYDNSKIYKVGDQVYFTDGNTYVMVEGAGAPGYAPLRPGDQLWKKMYDNTKVYKIGDQVYFTDGSVYVMVEGAGAPGYAPLRPGDQLWKKVVGGTLPYDNNRVYQIGNMVSFSDGNTYVMVEGAGAPGYAPLRPGDRLWRRAN